MPIQSLKLTAEPPPNQAVLFSDDKFEQLLQREESKGIYTAERLKARDPVKYQRIMELLGLGGWGQKRIAKFLNVHHRTVAAVDAAEPQSIDTQRDQIVRDLRCGSRLQIERLIEHPDLVPMQVAGLVATQLLTAAELLDGRATERVEHVKRVNIYDDWPEFVGKHLRPEPVGMGLAGEKLAAIGDSGNESPAALVPHTDIESDVLPSASKVEAHGVSTSVAVRAAVPSVLTLSATPSSKTGGGGDAGAVRGADGPTGHGTDKILYNRSA